MAKRRRRYRRKGQLSITAKKNAIKRSKPVRKALFDARYKQRLSITEVAAKTGIHPSDYHKFEKGRKLPSLEGAAKLQKVLKTPVETLFPDVFYRYSEFWDEFYRFHGFTYKEILKSHEKHAKYRLFHPRKRPRGAGKDWNQWVQ